MDRTWSTERYLYEDLLHKIVYQLGDMGAKYNLKYQDIIREIRRTLYSGMFVDVMYNVPYQFNIFLRFKTGN